MQLPPGATVGSARNAGVWSPLLTPEEKIALRPPPDQEVAGGCVRCGFRVPGLHTLVCSQVKPSIDLRNGVRVVTTRALWEYEVLDPVRAPVHACLCVGSRCLSRTQAGSRRLLCAKPLLCLMHRLQHC